MENIIVCRNGSGLAKALNIKKGIISFVGGGGKSTIINAVAKELKQSVIITTTTKIYAPNIYYDNLKSTEKAIKQDNIITVGKPYIADGLDKPKLEIAVEPLLLADIADYILVEADGSKHLPIKMPAESEPVIPEGSVNNILVCGIDALNMPILKVCHRANLVADFLNKNTADILTIEDMAEILNNSYSNIDTVVINKADDDYLINIAVELASMIKYKTVICGGMV